MRADSLPPHVIGISLPMKLALFALTKELRLIVVLPACKNGSSGPALSRHVIFNIYKSCNAAPSDLHPHRLLKSLSKLKRDQDCSLP